MSRSNRGSFACDTSATREAIPPNDRLDLRLHARTDLRSDAGKIRCCAAAFFAARQVSCLVGDNGGEGQATDPSFEQASHEVGRGE